MINKDFLISQQTLLLSRLSWNSQNSDDVSYVSVNGVMINSPIYLDTVNRFVDIAMKAIENKSITIQDFDSISEFADPVEIEEIIRPIFTWSSVIDAVRYRIYHTPFSGVESLIYDEQSLEIVGLNEVRSPIDLVEGWHLFRVESVDKFGNESTRFIWPYRTFRLPEPVNDLTVINGSGSGLFDITI